MLNERAESALLLLVETGAFSRLNIVHQRLDLSDLELRVEPTDIDVLEPLAELCGSVSETEPVPRR